MVKRVLLLSLMALLGWTTLLSPAWAFNDVDNEVYNTCAEIKMMAVQILSTTDMARLNGMSDLECEHRLGGMTHSELKKYLISKEFKKEFARDITVAAMPALTEMPDSGPPKYRTVHQHDEEGNIIGHTHVPNGVVGQHDFQGGWLEHQWYNAGRKHGQLRAWVDLHHFQTQFYKFQDIGGVTFNGQRFGNKYVFYRNASVSGYLYNERQDYPGQYRKFRFTVRYQYQYCDNSNQTGCTRWTSKTRRKTCRAWVEGYEHYTRAPHCYIVE